LTSNMPSKELVALPSALEEFSTIQTSIGGRQVAFFLDYDGTLTPIVARPEDAYLTGSMQKVLLRLASKHAVAIVSGRDLNDVKKRVGIDFIYYAGSHGFDISGPGGLKREFPQADAALGLLKKAEQEIKDAVRDIEGVHIERKHFSLAVHYRNVDVVKKEEVKKTLETHCQAYKGLKIVYGKEVFDLRPDIDWHKGKALLWLKDRMPLDKPIFSFYLGDDTTDEDAFRVLEQDGVGIIVGCDAKKTYAKYVLKNTQEVEAFLTRCAHE
jgi:trehalose-phosphatase